MLKFNANFRNEIWAYRIDKKTAQSPAIDVGKRTVLNYDVLTYHYLIGS